MKWVYHKVDVYRCSAELNSSAESSDQDWVTVSTVSTQQNYHIASSINNNNS